MDLDHTDSQAGALSQGLPGLRLSDLEPTLRRAWVSLRGKGSGYAGLLAS